MGEREDKINVLVDTNFLVDIFRFNISPDDVMDISGGNAVLFMVKQSIKELERIELKHAKIGLKFIESGKITILDRPGSNADDAILSFISEQIRNNQKGNVILATNDSRLRKKARDMGVRVIYLRARKHLEISN